MTFYFRVLGPVDAILNGHVVSFGAAKSRVLLAALLLRSNEYVSTSRVMTALWGEHPPATARATVHTYVMRLRKNLQQHLGGGRCPLRTEPGGYIFEASAGTLDVIAFDGELSRARAAGRDGRLAMELEHLDRALAIWRGPALSNVESDVLQRDEIPRLTEHRLKAIERRIDIQMAMGRAGDLVAELRSYTTEYPRRERFWSQLIEALCRTGRQAEALTAYQNIKEHLAEELGIDPGPELRALQMRILHGGVDADVPDPPPPRVETTLPVTTAAPRPASDTAGGACQLPIAVPDFVGRHDLMLSIRQHLQPAVSRAAPPIVAITGAPGAGKSALAVHTAWQVREHYPDGQWFVHLQGGDCAHRPSGEVLEELLQAAGVPLRQMPAGEGARVGALRAALAGRRVLIVLDGAEHMAQLTPLLPGAPGCAVLVTSRRCTVGFAALNGGRSVYLEELSQDESAWLLGRMIGVARVQAEPEAAQRLVDVCSGLPHALRIAAGQLERSPTLSLNDYLTQVEQRGPLEALSTGLHPASDLGEIMSSAWAELGTADQQSMLRLGQQFSSVAPGQAAEFLELPIHTAGRLLDRLAEAHLMRLRDGRYHFSALQQDFCRNAQTRQIPRHSMPHGHAALEKPKHSFPGITSGGGIGAD